MTELTRVRTFANKFLAAAISISLLCPAGLAPRVWAAEAAVTLDGLSVGDDMVTVKLSSKASYNCFLTATPPRLVIEFFDTENQVGAKEVAGKG